MFEKKLVVLMFMLFCVAYITATDLKVGTSDTEQMPYTENVILRPLGNEPRVKDVVYDSANKAIKGVYAIDLIKSNANATIVAGGVGYNFVHVKLMSEKGDGLNYQVQVYF